MSSIVGQLRSFAAWTVAFVVLGVVPMAKAAPLADPFLRSSAYAPRVAALSRGSMSSDPVELSQYVATNPAVPSMTPSEQNLVDVVLTSGYDGCSECSPGCYSGCYAWQLLPDGLMYRSYMAGPREPRIGTQFVNIDGPQAGGQSLWDGVVGGRAGVLRYGTGDSFNPQGWQLDFEGAALVRLNLDEDRDLDASDFRFGVPLTYASGDFQFKTGYYHLSSHLGDEYQVRNPSAERINYVRDAIMLGVSYNPTPNWRLYGETAYAVFTAGGAEPWEFQFGLEYAQAGPTGCYGTPFFATNAHLRQELDFGGDWTTQAGWLWRGQSGSTMRVGLHYMNGKSTQYQFFGYNEEQVGLGLWYDF